MHIKQEKICSLCFGLTENKFEIIDDITKEMLDVLLLEMDFEMSEEPIICENCIENVQKLFYFKSVCLETEELVRSLAVSSNGIKVELKHLYDRSLIKDYLDKSLGICRFCLSPFEGNNLIALGVLMNGNIFRKMLSACVPEMDVNITEHPVMCTYCRKKLESYFKFVQTCWNTKDKIITYCQRNGTNSEGKVNLSNLRHFLFEGVSEYPDTCTTKGEAKIYNDLLKSEELHIKEEMSPVGVETYECARSSYEKKHDSYFENCIPNRIDDPEVGLYKCAQCIYKTKHRQNLREHMLIHADSSEIRMYRCALCIFTTKRKGSLKTHMLGHKTTSELKMYKCGLCIYVTKWKGALKNHMLIHKDSSDVEMYKCTLCTYETKRKRNLEGHMQTHKDISDVKTYKCALCSYETKQKGHINGHMLTHKDRSEVKMYKCASCSYETKYKRSLATHMPTHKDSSKVKMYKCVLCSYETKWKGNIKIHMPTHKDSSEVKMYKCTQCSFETSRKYYLPTHVLKTHKNR